MENIPLSLIHQAAKQMVDTTDFWNNDLSNEREERDLFDSDFEVEADREETPHVYSPFSPYYTTKED